MKLRVKKCAFSWPLKRSRVSRLLIEYGKQFHIIGALLQKARSPKVFMVLWTSSSLSSYERNALFGFCELWNSFRYDGPIPCTHLCTINNTLNIMRDYTGNQWRDSSRGRELWNLPTLYTSRAAQFWMTCNFRTRSDLIPTKREFA